MGNGETGKWETGKWETGKWETGKWETGKWETGKWETKLKVLFSCPLIFLSAVFLFPDKQIC